MKRFSPTFPTGKKIGRREDFCLHFLRGLFVSRWEKMVPPTLLTKVPPVVTFTENRVGGGKFLP